MKQPFPKITKEDIQQLSSSQSFQRGMNYHCQGALFELVKQGTEVRAYCEGSSYQPYQVSAVFDSDGIHRTSCTCPYDWGGVCKHVVALLLAVANEPESFHTIAPLDKLLADRSKDDLISLIKEMLKREPNLMRLLELPVQPDRTTPLDLEVYRRQIDYALRPAYDYDYDYYGSHNMATELSTPVENAERFQESGDWINAGALYALILNEVVPKYEELYDEDGAVSVVLQACANGLGACLQEGDADEQTRCIWLKALLAAELKDIEMGGMDLAYPAGEIVVTEAADDEWIWIEKKIEQAIAAQTNQYSSWGQESLVSLLAARLKMQGRDDEVQDLIFEQGSAQQKAFLLIEQKRFEDAVKIAQPSFSDYPGLVSRFADALVAAGGGEQAEAYVSSLLNTRSRSSYIIWLAAYAEQTGRHTTALNWRQKSMLENPRLDTYKQLRKTATKLNCWRPLHQEILGELENKGNWPILIDIALDEKDIPHALDLLPRLKAWTASSYEMRVAEAAEEEYPQAAINVYRRYVERLISARGRGNYQTAAALVNRMKALYQKQGKLAAWQEFVTYLRQEYSRLPALQDEMNKARL